MKPSEITDVYWLYARRQIGTYPEHTPTGGKWLIFMDVVDVDRLWDRIKRATTAGKLSSAAKVSTAKPNPNAKALDQEIICVYTYDCTDEEDVMRI